MPQANLTNDEWGTIAEALNTELRSAQRAQKTGKTPHIKEVYKLHEAVIQELISKTIKLANAKQ